MSSASAPSGTFSLFGFPVRIRISFLVVTGLIGLLSIQEPLRIVAWMLVVGVSILVHELGHAFMGRAFGRNARIELHGMGGVCVYEPGAELTTARRILIALAGPMAGFVLGGLVLLLALYTPLFIGSDVAKVTLLFLLWVNFGWGLLNLIPMLPLDGGMVMHALIRHVKGEAGSIRPALRASIAVSAVAAIAAVYADFHFAAVLAAWFGFSNFEQLRALKQIGDDAPLRQKLVAAIAATNAGQHEIALELASEVMDHASNPQLVSDATQIVASILSLLERFDEALEVLERVPPPHHPPPFLEAQLRLRTGQLERAVTPARKAFRADPSPGTARVLAEALAANARERELLDLMRNEGTEHLDLTGYEIIQAVSAESGLFEISLEAADTAFVRWHEPRVAFNAACTHAALDHIDAAFTWLERAVDAGWHDAHAIIEDPDLDPLRIEDEHLERLQRLADRVRPPLLH